MAAAAACAAAASAAAASAGSTRELPLICTPSDASSVIAARRSDGVPFREEPSSPTVSDGDATACATGVGGRRLAVADVGGGGVNGGAGPAADTARRRLGARVRRRRRRGTRRPRRADLLLPRPRRRLRRARRLLRGRLRDARLDPCFGRREGRCDRLVVARWAWEVAKPPDVALGEEAILAAVEHHRPPAAAPPPPPPRPSSPSPVPPPISSWYAAERRQNALPRAAADLARVVARRKGREGDAVRRAHRQVVVGRIGAGAPAHLPTEVAPAHVDGQDRIVLRVGRDVTKGHQIGDPRHARPQRAAHLRRRRRRSGGGGGGGSCAASDGAATVEVGGTSRLPGVAPSDSAFASASSPRASAATIGGAPPPPSPPLPSLPSPAPTPSRLGLVVPAAAMRLVGQRRSTDGCRSPWPLWMAFARGCRRWVRRHRRRACRRRCRRRRRGGATSRNGRRCGGGGGGGLIPEDRASRFHTPAPHLPVPDAPRGDGPTRRWQGG